LVDLATHKQEAKIDVCTAQSSAAIVRANGATWNSFSAVDIYLLDVARRGFDMLMWMLAAQELVVLGILVIFPIFCRAYVNGSAAEQEIVNADANFRS